MKLYRTVDGPVVEEEGRHFLIAESAWDELAARENIEAYLRGLIATGELAVVSPPTRLLAPVAGQEVWAAGVTYWRSREARMVEAKSAGGGDFYDRVYSAQRPELFFKAQGHRVVGPGGKVRIRRDSNWNVPEPELTLLIAASGAITGYTIGNDMSSRAIEGENPLYLPQAKTYDGSCAIGPCILLGKTPLPADTAIEMRVRRQGAEAFSGSTTISQIKRELLALVEYLFREMTFARGCFLMTGTGVIPPDSFTLQRGDEIAITMGPIGTLVNVVG